MAYLDRRVNASRDQDARQALAPLAVLADKVGVAVVVVRHLTKTGGENALYRGGGSIGIIGTARSGLLAATDPEDPAGGAAGGGGGGGGPGGGVWGEGRGTRRGRCRRWAIGWRAARGWARCGWPGWGWWSGARRRWWRG